MSKEKIDKGVEFPPRLKRLMKRARNKRIRRSKDLREWKLYKGWLY